MMEERFIKWQCFYCKEIIISDRHAHHQMDVCKCRCGVDAEREYVRILGNVDILDCSNDKEDLI